VSIERVNLATGRREPLAAPDARILSGADWGGLRVERVQNPAAEWPEGYTVHDLVAVHLSETCAAESWWPGSDQRVRRFRTGSVFIVPARMPFRHRTFGATESFQLSVSREFLAAAGSTAIEVRPVFGEEDPLVAQLLVALCEELRTGERVDRLYAESLATALVAHLTRKYRASGARSGVRRGGLAAHKLRLVHEYVDAHLDRELGLRDLASLVRMNVDSFLRAFRQSTGETPHRYVVRQRILRARALLRVAELPIAEISSRCGFHGPASFTRAFHRLTGATPREYRTAI
jgi:AraC family transcriptional regulator